MKNKRRKLIHGAERFLRVVRGLAITMQTLLIGLMAWLLFECNLADAFEWSDVGYMLAGLLSFLFWYWLGSMASELLEYA